jgi:hypothetical protein
LFRTLAARADLDPGSQQLVVGGTGSGKTTELLMAEKWLREQGQTVPLYIDVSGDTDLSALKSGALLASFGLRLAREFHLLPGGGDGVPPRLDTLVKQFAFGKTEATLMPAGDWHAIAEAYAPPLNLVYNRTPGKLNPRFPVLPRDVEEIAGILESCVAAFGSRAIDIIVIFDGLDRLIFPEKFWAVVDQDLRVLRRLKVSVLAAAPLSTLYGEGRAISEHFDRIHQVRAVVPELTGRSVLKSVLSRRDNTGLLHDAEAELICSFSGGVLRDLLTLARDAGEIAYIEGTPYIYPEHVASAVAQLGEGYRRGLSPTHIEILRRLEKEHAFDPSSNDGVELLVTGRVIEYSATDFRVHPALAPLIAQNDTYA